MLSIKIPIKVPFYDVDSMHIVWHGNYARYFEEARCALLDMIGYSYTRMAETGFIWPIVEMKTKFVRSAKFGQEIEVTARLLEYENRIKIEYRVFDQASGELLTKAETTQLCVDMASGEMQLDAPDELIQKVRQKL